MEGESTVKGKITDGRRLDPNGLHLTSHTSSYTPQLNRNQAKMHTKRNLFEMEFYDNATIFKVFIKCVSTI